MTQQHAPSCSGTHRHFSREKKEGGKRGRSSEDGKRRVRDQTILGKRDEKKGKRGKRTCPFTVLSLLTLPATSSFKKPKTKKKEVWHRLITQQTSHRSIQPLTAGGGSTAPHRTALSQGFKVSALACPALHYSARYTLATSARRCPAQLPSGPQGHTFPPCLRARTRPPFPAHSLGLNASMPSLGFLKKKRTRDTDRSATTQPASPVAPTTARSFDTTTLPTSPTAAHSTPQKVAPRPLSQGEKGAMYSATAQPPSSFAPPAHSPSPGADPNHHLQPGVLPSIANLINPPQNDGAAQSLPPPSQPPQSIPTTSQQSLDQQQQQPQQTQFPAPPQNGGTAPQPTQMAAQQPTPSPTPQLQQTALLQQSRQTKGKYSLADFEILRTLGTGSFGRVHLVQSRHNQRFYAVKVLKKAQVVKMKQVEHTNDERKMLGEVKHPFLITLWGTFQDPKNLYMVMDFVEGGELFSLLRKSGVSCPPKSPRAEEKGEPLPLTCGLSLILALSQSRRQILRRRGHLGSRIPPRT